MANKPARYNTGPIMWWKRKPKGAFAPPARTNAPVGRDAIIILVLLAAFLPLFALSVLVVWLLDRLLYRNRRKFYASA